MNQIQRGATGTATFDHTATGFENTGLPPHLTGSWQTGNGLSGANPSTGDTHLVQSGGVVAGTDGWSVNGGTVTVPVNAALGITTCFYTRLARPATPEEQAGGAGRDSYYEDDFYQFEVIAAPEPELEPIPVCNPLPQIAAGTTGQMCMGYTFSGEGDWFIKDFATRDTPRGFNVVASGTEVVAVTVPANVPLGLYTGKIRASDNLVSFEFEVVE